MLICVLSIIVQLHLRVKICFVFMKMVYVFNVDWRWSSTYTVPLFQVCSFSRKEGTM